VITAEKTQGFLLRTLNAGETHADSERWAKSIDSTGRLPRTPVPGHVRPQA
jgi:hypothetical protein